MSTSKETNLSDNILFIVILFMFLNKLFWHAIFFFSPEFYNSFWYLPINALLTLIWSIIPLVLAIIVKDESKRILLLIIGGLYLLTGVYEAVKGFLN